MKIFSLILFMMLFTSCKNQQEKLINNANSYIANNFVQNMDNPKSYEFVKTSILDTFTNRDSIFYGEYSFYLESINHILFREKILRDFDLRMRDDRDFDKNYNIMIDDYKKVTESVCDSIKKSIINIDNKIYYINLRHIFRGQNKFGAIILDTINIQYNYRNKSFNIK